MLVLVHACVGTTIALHKSGFFFFSCIKAHSCPHSICKQQLPCALRTQRRFFHANHEYSQQSTTHARARKALTRHSHTHSTLAKGMRCAYANTVKWNHSRWWYILFAFFTCTERSMASFGCESMFYFFFFPFFLLFIHCVRVLNGNDGLLWPQLLLLEQQQPTKSENQKSKYYFQHRFDILRFLGRTLCTNSIRECDTLAAIITFIYVENE